jgi:hypothetical protein
MEDGDFWRTRGYNRAPDFVTQRASDFFLFIQGGKIQVCFRFFVCCEGANRNILAFLVLCRRLAVSFSCVYHAKRDAPQTKPRLPLLGTRSTPPTTLTPAQNFEPTIKWIHSIDLQHMRANSPTTALALVTAGKRTLLVSR